MLNSLLMVDDEPAVLRSISRLLKRDDYQIYTAKCGEEALELLRQHPIDVVLSDQRMPRMSGSQLLGQVKKLYPDTIRLIISGYADFKALREGINEGEIYKFLAKPWNGELLRADIREAFQVQELRQYNNRLSHLFDNTIEAIILSDAQGIIENVNPAFSKITQFSSADVIGQPVGDYFFNADSEALPDVFQTSRKNTPWHGELFCRVRSGGVLPIWLSTVSMKGCRGDIHGAALFIDITEQKTKEARIEYQAYHDELTGLPNRRLFNDHLELAFHQHRRNQKILAVLFLDLDRFKHINDSLGHEVGDQLLQGVATRLKKIIRKGETLARFGGDEFVVILPAIGNIAQCEKVAEKIIDSLKEPFSCSEHKIYISPSIGISSSLTDGESLDLTVRHADSAMYRAKAIGGNNYQLFKGSNAQNLKKKVEVESGLHEGVINNEFVVYYQPQSNPQDGRVCGCEALVRWHHPQKGVILPDRFINVAEQTGLIIPIGKSVLQQACKHLSLLRYRNQLQCSISVNLSVRQFNDNSLLPDIIQLIERFKIEPQWLELEVTESIFVSDMAKSITILSALRDIGVRIALDDFGTGYSSLSYLKELPVDTLKLDQSFVRGLPRDKKSTTITLSLLAMARGLGLSVVAEGVETKEQNEFLRNEGVDLIQGFFLSPAITSKDFVELLLSQRKAEAACGTGH